MKGENRMLCEDKLNLQFTIDKTKQSMYARNYDRATKKPRPKTGADTSNIDSCKGLNDYCPNELCTTNVGGELEKLE